MAAHELAIAKAAFLAGCIRPDPATIPRAETDSFYTSLDKATERCSPVNIQICKSWLLKHVLPSSARVNLLGKYLVALSRSLDDAKRSGNGDSELRGRRKLGSTRRRRLHILYLLNDVLHHCKYHQGSTTETSAFSTFSSSIQPHIFELFNCAARYSRESSPKLHHRLTALVQLWGRCEYFSNEDIDQLHKIVHDDGLSGTQTKASTPSASEKKVEDDLKTKSREAPYLMPAVHGDPNAPYHELPAANLMPHIIPNSTAPIQPPFVRALQFAPGPADPKLVDAMKNFFDQIDKLYATGDPMELMGERTDEIVDIDELGQLVARDQLTGDILDGETYYGWSRGFCEKMKKRKTGDGKRGRDLERGRLSRSVSSYSRSESGSRVRGRGRSMQKRARSFSSSRSRSASSVDSRRRGGHYYRSYSRSPRRSDQRMMSRSPSPERSTKRFRSRSPVHDRSPPRGSSRAYPPPPANPTSFAPPAPQSFPPMPFSPAAVPGHAPLPGNGMLFPPPPPPNWNGPWPPPPPPPMPFAPSPGMPSSMPPFPPPGMPMAPRANSQQAPNPARPRGFDNRYGGSDYARRRY